VINHLHNKGSIESKTEFVNLTLDLLHIMVHNLRRMKNHVGRNLRQQVGTLFVNKYVYIILIKGVICVNKNILMLFSFKPCKNHLNQELENKCVQRKCQFKQTLIFLKIFTKRFKPIIILL
jgi:hypothetical protein